MGHHRLSILLLISSACLAAESRVVTDDIAYGHFFMMLAPPSSSVEAQASSADLLARRLAYIKHVGLNPEQGQVLVSTAERYHEHLRQMKERLTQIAGPAAPGVSLTASQKAEMEHALLARRNLLIQLIRELHQKLDDQGDRIVSEYINNKVKPGIRFK